MAFIGIDNLTHVKDKLQTNIIMGPAYYSADELKRMAIKVITGVEFKDTATIFNRKGGTARRKVVGQSQNSTLGYMTERVLEAHIVWDHYTANEDDFQEKPVMITINGSAQPSFPKTEEFIDQIGIAFNDNVFPCVWHGDENSDKPEMALFNGLHADLDKDIANGDVSEAAGNLIPCAVLDAPATEGDSSAWEEFVKWYNKWHPALKRRETIVYMSTAYGNHIADAYEQNAADYIAELNALDAEYEAAVADAEFDTILFGDRFPFRYLTDDYGIKYYAAFAGCSAETEASFETVVFLAGKADELGLNVILTIDGGDSAIAKTIIDNTTSKNQEILVLDSMQSTKQADTSSYVAVMESNLDILTKALA